MVKFHILKLNWTQFIQVLLTLGALSSSPVWAETELVGQSIEVAMLEDMLVEDPVNQALAKEAYDNMWLALSQSDIVWIKTTAAIHFIRFSDSKARDVGESLLNTITTKETLDVHTLWLLLDLCSPRHQSRPCSSIPIQERLIELAPNNAAVYLSPEYPLDGPNWRFGEDNDQNRQALLAASQAQSFDTYYGAGAIQLYEELEEFVDNFPPSHRPEIYFPRHVQAFNHTLSVIMMRSLRTFQGLFALCEAQVHEWRSEHVEACFNLSKTMQTTGKTSLTRSLGYALERRMVDTVGGDKATSLFLFRKSRMTTQILLCQKPFWANGIDALPELEETTVTAYLADLETGGELGAIRNSAIRQFQENPKSFEHDPSQCDELINLDSDSMGMALGRLDPKLTHGLQ